MKVTQNWDVETDETEITIPAVLEYGTIIHGFYMPMLSGTEPGNGGGEFKMFSGGGVGGDYLTLRQPGKPTVTIKLSDLAVAMIKQRNAMRGQWRMEDAKDPGEEPE
jgi:hypothetical protein